MDRRRLLAIGRLAFVGLSVVAITAQVLDLASRGVLNPVNFFSYFTIQSNLIAIAALALPALATLAGRSTRYDLLRGAAVVYMTVTGVVYALLLSGTDVDTAVPWVNAVVHQVMPIVVVVDWLLDPPAPPLPLRRTLVVWIAYPIAWIAYTMVRGAIATGIRTRSWIRAPAATARDRHDPGDPRRRDRAVPRRRGDRQRPRLAPHAGRATALGEPGVDEGREPLAQRVDASDPDVLARVEGADHPAVADVDPDV